MQLNHELTDLTGLILSKSTPSWYRKDNDATSWTSIAKGTNLISIDGVCLAEAQPGRDAEGKVVFDANLVILESAWLPRFEDRTGLSKVTHMIGVHAGSGDPIITHAKLLKLMGVYRTLSDLAQQLNRRIDLTKVEIVLFDAGLWNYGPTFIGNSGSRASSTESREFVQRYTDITLPAGNSLNYGVEVSYSAELVRHYKNIAIDLMSQSQRVLNLEDAERLFGDYVPSFKNGSNNPVEFGKKSAEFRIVDSMDGSFSMGDHLI